MPPLVCMSKEGKKCKSRFAKLNSSQSSAAPLLPHRTLPLGIAGPNPPAARRLPRRPGASSQGLDGGLDQVVGEMVQPFEHGQAQGGVEQVAGLSGVSLGSLVQEFQARVGEQGMLAAGAFQGMRDEGGKALPFEDRAQLVSNPDPAGEGGVRHSIQGLRKAGVAHQPDREQVVRVEGEVEKGREIPEEVRQEILGFVKCS